MFIILQILYIIVHHHTSSYIIIYHTWFLSSLLSILWIQVSRQFSFVKSLFRSQSSPALQSGQDSPILSSFYLRLKGSLTLPSSESFQNCTRHIHMSAPIVSGNLQRLVPSSLALLVSNLCYLVNIP